MTGKLLAAALLPLTVAAADIYMAGDSTMATYPAARAPLTGWGQALQTFCKPGVRVYNFARSGESSKSFLNNAKMWPALIAAVKPGDFVIIQFGHNDAHKGEKNAYRHTEPDGEFQDNLKRMISEVRAKKATPVLMTQTAICRFRDGKQFNRPVEKGYIAATRKVASKTGVEFIDFNAWHAAKLNALGQEEGLKLYLNLAPGESPNFPKGRKDDCHFRDTGAQFCAAGMVECAKRQKLSVAELFR